MLSRRNLTIWIAAARGDAGAIAELNSHWFSGELKLPATWGACLYGPESWIMNSTTAINQKLVSQGIVSKEEDVTAQFMAAQQWAAGNLLNNDGFAMNPNLTAYTNMSSARQVGMNFLTQPEISQSGCDVDFTAAMGLSLFNQDISTKDTDSVLSAINYFDFQEAYQTQ